MSLKKYLIFMTTATFICWLAWLIVVFYVNPQEAGFLGFTMFYVSLFLALTGTFSLVGFFGRVWFTREAVIFRHLGISTRHAVWFALLLVCALLLQGSGFLRWWNIFFLVLLFTLLEFFFLSRKVIRR